jgi:eukaryotic-like serine/threonine-protein kinase
VNVNDPPSDAPSTIDDDLSAGTFGRLVRAIASVPGRERSDVGRTFGRYQITGELGRGGMGIVYEALDTELGRRVALKLLPGELVGADRRALFLGEVVVTAGLEHPGIVPVYDAGETPDGDLFYTMKKVSGRTLAALIAEAPALPDRMALLPHLIACANAVAYAHDLGIIHRDLKPANVVIGAFGETVVVDWGIATRVRGDADAGEPLYSRQLGTPAYMAPEQTAGAELTRRTDVYALGAMLYELLDGRPPPRTGIRFDARSDLPPELVAVMRKAMADAPDQRYPSLRELAEELRRFQAGQLVGAHRYTLRGLLWRWLGRHRSAVIAAGVLAVTLAVFGLASVRAIVQGRDTADAARRAAERAQANTARRNRELLLLHARAEVEHDPTAALAWLKRSDHEPANRAEEQQIATDAWARGPARYVMSGPGAFTSIAIAAGARVVAASLQDRILWWDDLSRPPHELRARDGIGAALAITADGHTVVSSDVERAMRVWDLATGASRRVAVGAARVRLTPAGDGVVVLHPPDRPRLFTLPDLTELALAGDAEAVAILDDGDQLAVARAETIELIDRSRRVVASYRRTPLRATAVAVSHDGRSIGVATTAGVDVLERATGRWQRFPTDHMAPEVLRLSPDGRWAASCGAQPGVQLFDLRTHTATTLSRTERCFQSMTFSPDGALLTVGYDDNVHVWDVATGQSRALRGQQGAISAMQLSPDGDWLVATGNDATVRVFWLATRRTTTLRDAAAISPLAATAEILVRDAGRTFAIRSLTGGAEPLARVDYRAPPADAALGGLSRDGHIACFLDAEGAIVVVDRTARRRSSFGPYPDGELTVAELSPRGALLVTGSERGIVRVIDLATGASRVLGQHDRGIDAARFSFDEARLATGDRGGRLRLWELGTGGSALVTGHTGRIWDIAFARDGSWLASASSDGTVRTFRDDGRLLAVLDGHAGPILAVDIAPTGAELLSTGIDGAVRRWSVATGRGAAIRWYPTPLWNGRYSADGTRYSATYTGGLIVTDPTQPAVPRDELGRWLDATTTATVDDTGHLGGPASAPTP